MQSGAGKRTSVRPAWDSGDDGGISYGGRSQFDEHQHVEPVVSKRPLKDGEKLAFGDDNAPDRQRGDTHEALQQQRQQGSGLARNLSDGIVDGGGITDRLSLLRSAKGSARTR